MAGRGKLSQTKKDKSPGRVSLPLGSPFDEFKLSPSTSSRRSSDANLLPGLPDKTPRTRKNKSPLTKASTTKDGTIEVPGLGSRLEQIVDDKHQSNHFGDPPLKEHRGFVYFLLPLLYIEVFTFCIHTGIYTFLPVPVLFAGIQSC